jgi:hypothetical protein
MLDIQFFGLRSGFHHLTNVLLHAISALLLFALLVRMTGDRWRSASDAIADSASNGSFSKTAFFAIFGSRPRGAH